MEVTAWQPVFQQFVQQAVGDAAHDLLHIQRVVRSALQLAQEEGADPAIVFPAAWLHDCVTITKDSAQRPFASQLAADAATTFLQTVHYPAAYLPAIAHAIAAHSFSARIPPQTVEAKVVQDADRLDALGAVGIARTLMLGGALQRPLYHPDDPFCQQRPANDYTATIDHFYTKLLTLADTMQTASGRQEAQRRTQFMHQYLAQLRGEIE
jgi:uncharacterized protein